MAKLIKRVGIVFLILVVTCLLLVSSMLVINVTENNNSVVVADSKNNITTNNNAGEYTAKIPTASKEYFMQHKEDCTDQTTCTCMQDVWSEANQEGLNTGEFVKVTLMNDWIAYDDENHSFGSSRVGFSDTGFIRVEAKMILDLNGHTIDKRFTEVLNGKYLPAIYVLNDFTLMDSAFDYSVITDIYNKNKADKDTLIAKLKELNCGKITGGSTAGNGGGLNTSGGSSRKIEINILGGMFVDNIASHGGGINIYPQVTLNFFNGAVVGNIANGGSAGICSEGNISMYGGIIAGNEAKAGSGGGIYCANNTFNLYNGIITYNKASDNGGGVSVNGTHTNTADYIVTKYAHFNMYGGHITYNGETRFAGGVACNSAIAKMYGGEVSYNKSTNDSAGVLVWFGSKFEMLGGKISFNSIDYKKVNGNNGGAGIAVGSYAEATITEGDIVDNTLYSTANYAVNGAGIYVGDNGILNLNGGDIKRNIVNSFEPASIGGGVYVRATGQINIGGPVHMYLNECGNYHNDLSLNKNVVANITGRLYDVTKNARIGVDLPSDYPTTPFTKDYSLFNTDDPSMFFLTHTGGKGVFLEEGELVFKAATVETLPVLTWSWGDGEDEKNQSVVFGLRYTGKPFTIKCEGKSFYKRGNATPATSFEVTDAGMYSFYVNEKYFNSTFTFKIFPKEVDVKWKNTELEYNGGLQKPTAYIAEDSNCKVTVIGDEIDAGSGYVATATGLSNSNYMIKNNTSSTLYNISKAKLAKPFGSGSFEYNGAEKEFIPNGYNLVTMNITGNKATEVGSYNAVVSIKDKHNYEWLDGTNEDITLSYAITLAPPVNEETGVYRFIYLAEEGDKQVRKTYKESGLVHGINDSEVNGGKAVIGNIAPNTSVKEFIETLGFDTSKIVLKDNKGKDIYKNNVPVDIATYDNKYELAVGTGWRVEYTNNGNTETIYLSVLGDVTGDGRISAVDVTYLRQIANDKDVYDNLSVEKKLASLVLNVGIVTTADAEIIRNIMDNKLSINLFY